MNLDRVTITGADDSVDPRELGELAAEFPFVEWGILVSASSEGAPRFPTRQWVGRLVDNLGPEVRLSLHVCGRWVRDLMVGRDSLLREWGAVDRFQRLQLNFHARHHDVLVFPAADLLRRLGKQVIVQMDGTSNEGLLWLFRVDHGLDCAPLFDTSGGAGVVPASWPRPFSSIDYHGYAGGLGPETLLPELFRIADAVGDGEARIWIDMERRVRTEDDSALDLGKVRRVLAACRHLVTP
jgi:hypothetical protein